MTELTEVMRLAQRWPDADRFTRRDLYTMDVLWVLYDRVLNVSARKLTDPARDRFVLSKGHLPVAYYAVLAAKGFFPADWLDTGAMVDSRLGDHPDATLIPGVEVGSGSLGHGLGIGVGLALGLRAQGFLASRVVVLVGDSELDEGANDEAITYAGAVCLDSLTVVVADNGNARYRRPGGLAARFEVAGWSSSTVDGQDHDALEKAFVRRPGRPHVVIARWRDEGWRDDGRGDDGRGDEG